MAEPVTQVTDNPSHGTLADVVIAADMSVNNYEERAGKKEMHIGREHMPFVCGYCHQEFDRISPYFLHIKEHNEAVNDSFHICGNFEDQRNLTYRCKKCQMAFPSVCMLHSHLLICSGSYVYDHEHCLAFPIEDLYNVYIKGRMDEAYDREHSVVSSEATDKDNDAHVREVPDSFAAIWRNMAKNDTPKQNDHKEDNSKFEEVHTQTDDVCFKEDSEQVKEPIPTVRKRGRPKKLLTNVKEIITNVKEIKKEKRGRPKKIFTNVKEITTNVKEIKKEKRTRRKKSSEKEYKTKAKEEQPVDPEYVEAAEPDKAEPDDAEPGDADPDYRDPDEADPDYSESDEAEPDDADPDDADPDDASPSHSLDDEEKVVPRKRRRRNVEKSKRTLPRKRKPKKESRCEVCGKLFGDKSKLRMHMYGHSATKNFVCDICSAAFKYPTNLQSHMRTHPLPEDATYKAGCRCEMCGKLCMDLSKLRMHMYSHSEARNFVCEVCSASYKYPNHLQVHMKIHSDVKPFYCDLCGEGFIVADRLEKHKICKHSKDRNHRCAECGATFKFQSCLKRHAQSHTPEKLHQCDTCGQQFSRRNYLVQHMRIHTGARRFECSQEGCQRKFYTNYQLQCHLKMHSGERPYKCPTCPAEFIQRKELRRHLKKMHGQNLDDMNLELDVLMVPCTTSSMTTGTTASSEVDMILSGAPMMSSPLIQAVKYDTPMMSTSNQDMKYDRPMMSTPNQDMKYDRPMMSTPNQDMKYDRPLQTYDRPLLQTFQNTEMGPKDFSLQSLHSMGANASSY